jgi:hypothetical protein
MNRSIQAVPHGYEPPAGNGRRGTLVYYDDFEQVTDAELSLALDHAETRGFEKLVLYPLHDETVKRFSKKAVSAYYKREDRLHEWKREHGRSFATVEGWEGKRKKYTPIDAALRHVTEVYTGPHFLYVTPETANLFASFASFEEWIVKLRLVVSEEPASMHPKLVKYRHRIDIAGEAADKS